jgi:hypothetical protein
LTPPCYQLSKPPVTAALFLPYFRQLQRSSNERLRKRVSAFAMSLWKPYLGIVAPHGWTPGRSRAMICSS